MQGRKEKESRDGIGAGAAPFKGLGETDSEDEEEVVMCEERV